MYFKKLYIFNYVEQVDNWNELPGAASYSDNAEGNREEVFGPAPRPSGSPPRSASHGKVAASPQKNESAASSSGGAAGGGGGGDFNLEQEKQLPGVVMACQGPEVFGMLFKLAQQDDQGITNAVRSVLSLIPTDHDVSDKFDSICTGGSHSHESNTRSSPFSSPAKKDKIKDKEKRNGQTVLKFLLDLEGSDMAPFKLLYHLEVLSGKIMPPSTEGSMQGNGQFCEEFLVCGGLTLVTSLLRRDSVPQDVNYWMRQNIYFIVLQILRSVIHIFNRFTNYRYARF